MADEKNPVAKATDAAADAEKAAKKTAKKVTKVAKKTTKKVTKKATAAKKTASKKATAAKKTVSKKATSAKKTATKKATSAKKAAKTEAEKVESRIEQLQAMLKDNLSGLSGDKAEVMAKNIWLAGLGAYSRAFEELSDRYDDVQDKYEEINAEGQKVFADLVKRGQSMQGELEDNVSKGRESLEDRVEEFKQRFGGGLSSFVDLPERLREAAEKVEEISKRLRGKKK